MKPTEFAHALQAGGKLLPDSSPVLASLAELFNASPAATVAATIAKLRKANIVSSEGRPKTGEALAAIAPLLEFLKGFGKPVVAKDLQTLATFLESVPQLAFHSLIEEGVAALNKPAPTPPVLKEDVVRHHLNRLEQSLGDDPRFTAAYKELELDPEVGKLEIAALVKRFADANTKSRPAALKKILSRHKSLMTQQGKSDSRQGRGAG